jgi:soluble lytic murein transglycosylase
LFMRHKTLGTDPHSTTRLRSYWLLGIFGALALVLYVAFTHYQYLHRYDPLIRQVAGQYQLDPDLVRAVIYEESYFNAQARSDAGAVGLMQVTSITVREWKRITGYDSLAAVGRADNRTTRRTSEAELLRQPEINVQLGCWYLNYLSERYDKLDESLPVVLASYNAGPTHGARWQQAVPQPYTTAKFIAAIDFPETRNYVQRILQRYEKYKQPGFAGVLARLLAAEISAPVNQTFLANRPQAKRAPVPLETTTSVPPKTTANK